MIASRNEPENLEESAGQRLLQRFIQDHTHCRVFCLGPLEVSSQVRQKAITTRRFTRVSHLPDMDGTPGQNLHRAHAVR